MAEPSNTLIFTDEKTLRAIIREELKGLNGGQYYTVEEAAEKLKVHPQHIYRLARTGSMVAGYPIVRVGKNWRVKLG